MVTSWVAARCSATTRQWLSDPPAMSAPKRWMTQASFIVGSLPRNHTRTKVPQERFVSSWLFHFASKARVLDRQVLDTREQHGVDALLPPEILLAVFEQPPRHRQQQPPLHDQNESADQRT